MNINPMSNETPPREIPNKDIPQPDNIPKDDPKS